MTTGKVGPCTKCGYALAETIVANYQKCARCDARAVVKTKAKPVIDDTIEFDLVDDDDEPTNPGWPPVTFIQGPRGIYTCITCGTQVYLSINLVANGARCAQCHGALVMSP